MTQQNRNHKQKWTILVLDDNKNVAKTLAMVLEQSGYRAVAAHTSEQGLEMAIRNTVDLALIDVNLPDNDGIRTAVKLCKQLSNCKILLISGDEGTNELWERALKEGIDFPILAKPIAPQRLLSTIRSLLGDRSDGHYM